LGGGICLKKEKRKKKPYNQQYKLEVNQKNPKKEQVINYEHNYINNDFDKKPDKESRYLMEEYDLDQDEAEHLQEIMDETGLDEDDANMLREEGL